MVAAVKPGDQFWKASVAGMQAVWQAKAKEHFLDIADDGYVIAAPVGGLEEDVQSLTEAFTSGRWRHCRTLDCIGECTDTNCACSRSKNPTARRGFTKHAVDALVELASDKQDVSYASLGCGFLGFDLVLVEALLEAGVALTAVHLVDKEYEPGSPQHDAHRAALAQFAARFAERGVDVYAHASFEKFAFRVRSSQALPLAVLQVDCSELTWIFDSEIKPLLEEVLHYGGLFLALTAREGAAPSGMSGALSDAFGEVWRLSPESGRLKVQSRLRYRPGEEVGQVLGVGDALPPATTH